jgi:hypothetical protein
MAAIVIRTGNFVKPDFYVGRWRPTATSFSRSAPIIPITARFADPAGNVLGIYQNPTDGPDDV